MLEMLVGYSDNLRPVRSPQDASTTPRSSRQADLSDPQADARLREAIARSPAGRSGSRASGLRQQGSPASKFHRRPSSKPWASGSPSTPT